MARPENLPLSEDSPGGFPSLRASVAGSHHGTSTLWWIHRTWRYNSLAPHGINRVTDLHGTGQFRKQVHPKTRLLFIKYGVPSVAEYEKNLLKNTMTSRQTWRCFKLPVTGQFVEKLVWANKKKYIKCVRYWPFERVVYPHKGPAMQEACPCIYVFMMTSSNGNIFRVTGHLCGEFTGPRWITRTRASDAEP